MKNDFNIDGYLRKMESEVYSQQMSSDFLGFDEDEFDGFCEMEEPTFNRKRILLICR